jgi:hypothetical protein
MTAENTYLAVVLQKCGAHDEGIYVAGSLLDNTAALPRRFNCG